SVVTLVGLALAIVLTLWGIHALRASIPREVADFIVEPRPSWRMFAVAAAVATLSVVLVGLAPAIRVSRVDPNDLLKAGAGTGAHRRNRRQYAYMVVAQLALSLALLAG